jgi:polar amino acid transport system substrate-binding protein
LAQSIFALVLGLLGHACNAASKIVILVSDPYPPYVMDGPGDQGYVAEMAIKILQDAGYQAQFIKVPFSRALRGLDKGNYDGLLAVSRGVKTLFTPKMALVHRRPFSLF